MRPLHWVFKIADRKNTINFYCEFLKMRVLRHEEFDAGCEATCNGPYNNKWSKTMVGYDKEDSAFVVELTYNYEVGSYKLGNDFGGLFISVPSSVKLSDASNFTLTAPTGAEDGYTKLTAPDSYPIFAKPLSSTENQEKSQPPDITRVLLYCTNLQNTLNFWTNVIGLQVREVNYEAGFVILNVSKEMNEERMTECDLKFIRLPQITPLDHGTAFGRIAFSSSKADQIDIAEKCKKGEFGGRIKTPLISLDTPGKATVEVVILSDPDEYEICIVGDDGFRELSRVDIKAQDKLTKAILEDKSDEWFAKKGRSKMIGQK